MWSVLPHCSVVFDVGANVGDWTALALRINSHLTIHCFEPSCATYQRLLARTPSQVICNNFGLSSRVEERTLFVFENHSGCNSLYRRQGLEDGWGLATQKREETIHLETIDDYCQIHGVQAIDFLKVDVEGHELEVFKGAKGMLSRGTIKYIQFEYGGCNIDARVLLKDIFEFFTPHPYNFFKIYPRELRAVPRYDQRLENFQYQNWALIADRESL